MEARDRARIVETAEAEAMAAHFATAPPDIAAELGMSVHRLHGAVATIMTADPTGGFWSRVIGAGIDEPLTERTLADVVELYRDHGMARVWMQVSPEARPAGSSELLTAAGFRQTQAWVKVVRDTALPPEPVSDLSVRLLAPDEGVAWATVCWTAFECPDRRLIAWAAEAVGAPDWYHFGAFDGDRLVSVGALFARGDVGCFFGAGTLPADRGRGGQGLLMAARMRTAAELGLRWLSAETGAETPEAPNPSLHNMFRYGFTEVYQRSNWVLELE